MKQTYGMIPWPLELADEDGKVDPRWVVACFKTLAGYNPDVVADVVEALEFAVSALCSVRKSYEESNGLWDDASRAIAGGNAALARLRSTNND